MIEKKRNLFNYLGLNSIHNVIEKQHMKNAQSLVW
jgi:hypothetical protein